MRTHTAAVAVGATTTLAALVRLLMWSRPYATIDRVFVPDDTYYTLTIARSIGQGDGPTADGENLTSGFQALQGFLAVPIFWFAEDPVTAARANLGLLLAADVVTVALVGWVAWRLAGPVAATVASGLWAMSPLALGIAAGGLETSLAMLAEVGLVAAWVAAHDRPSRRRWVVVGAVAGLAVLARVDAVFLVAALGAVQLWRGHRRGLLVAGPVAAAVLAPWWGWCWWRLGSPFPSSGTAARALAPYDAYARDLLSAAVGAVAGGPVGSLLGRRNWLLAHPAAGQRLYWLAVAVGVAATALLLRRRDPARLAAAALCAFSVALGLFYGWYGVVWYLYRYLAPVGLTATIAVGVVAATALGWVTAWMRGAGDARRPAGSLRLVAAVPVLLVVTAIGIATATRGVSAVGQDHPQGFAGDADTGQLPAADQALAHVPDGGRVGSWQSGALGYVAGDRVTVVNLDGVVNPAAADARAAARMPQYVDDQRLDWIIDWSLFTIGYEIQRLDAGLTPDVLVATIERPGKPLQTTVLRRPGG